ncbi:MAG: hypothetical protein JWP97_6492 [Labilithrix sp.]|nr:hypothetical protein [Labilithrix sp.]
MVGGCAMTDTREMTADARAHTDASLGVERASTDAATLRSVTRAQRALDDLLERDRSLADARLLRFRTRADRMIQDERSTSGETGTAVLLERQVADETTRTERAVVDTVLGQERDRADEAADSERREQRLHVVRHGLHRRATDDTLLTERTSADRAASHLEQVKRALAAVRSEQGQPGDLLGVVAHELRSPLSVVVLNAEFIAESSAEETSRDAAHDIVRAAARMERLLADLLDVTRIQGGAFTIAEEEQDVRSFLEEVRRTYEPLFAARDLSLSVEVGRGVTGASFDHDRIIQVLSNLFANAMKFTPRGGAVHVRAEAREGSQLEVTVEDNGPGISPTAITHVFDRFWQLDADITRGLGLGLYICKKIVEAHGGRITVDSCPGSGATFRFTLPCAPPAAARTA